MRHRYDGFTPARRKIFFETVAKTGCLADGCAAARVSRNTARRWRAREPGFEEEFQRCLALAAGALEKLAWERAVNGAPETLIRNGSVVQVRIKPSDAMLRLLLQASNPKKYGRTGRGGATRRQIEKRLRKEIEAEMWEKMRPRSLDEVRDSILAKLSAIERHRGAEAAAEAEAEDGE